MYSISLQLVIVYVLTVFSGVSAVKRQNSAESSSSVQEVRSHNDSRLTDLVGSFEDPNEWLYRGYSSILDFEMKIASSLNAQSINASARELSAPSFSCQSMNETFNPFFMCSDVVNYPYYLPQGTTLDDLEEVVRASVPSVFMLMTGPCLSDYKKMMCSRVFLKCVDGGMCI